MAVIQTRNSSSFLSFILKLTFVLFIITNSILFYFLYERNESQCIQDGTCPLNKKSKTLPRGKLGQTIYFKVLLEHFQRIKDQWRLIPKINFSKNIVTTELNCSSFQKISSMRFIAAGWTKSTYKIILNNSVLSMKTVNINGHDVTTCLQEKYRYLHDCVLIAASKLLKEISILHSLSHPNIVKILGYCVPADFDIENPLHTVSIFEEYGEPISVIKLLQSSWEDRLRISLGLSRLLKHLASFKDPIALNDFRRQQFVVINGELKLVDVDDIGFQDPKCRNDTACCTSHSASNNKSLCVSCINNVCIGYNEKINIMRTGSHFIKHILPHGAPRNLNSLIVKIVSAFESAFMNSNEILKEMENLTFSFKNGLYRKRKTKFLSNFEEFNHKDISANFDYRCQLTASGYGCTVSVLDAEEAAEFCLTDSQCKGFVITKITTWTGRRVTHFKNGIGKLYPNNATTSYVKLWHICIYMLQFNIMHYKCYNIKYLGTIYEFVFINLLILKIGYYFSIFYLISFCRKINNNENL